MTREAVHEHLESVLSSGSFSSSEKYSALLRYLVQRTLAGETPHEIDIAVDVFGKDHSYDPAESSSVRVCVHQLRRKLEDFYAALDEPPALRLSIPKGCYRVAFDVRPQAAAAADFAPRDGVSRAARERLSAALAGIGRPMSSAILLVLLLASLAGNLVLLQRLSPPPSGGAGAPAASAGEAPVHAAADFAWQDLLEGPEPILIAIGDVFLFTEPEQPSRYIRDIYVNSAAELRQLAEEGYGSSVMPSELTYLPKSTAFALQYLLPAAKATGKPVSLELMSEVTAQDLRENDVIYVGFFRSMGALRDYFLQSSNFAFETPYLELRRRDTGETFAWSGDLFAQTRDYGLFSKLPGPGRGEIVVFTGISGIGMLHTVRALTDPSSARAVEENVQAILSEIPSAVEILFEVSGYDRVGLEAKLAIASAAVEE